MPNGTQHITGKGMINRKQQWLRQPQQCIIHPKFHDTDVVLHTSLVLTPEHIQADEM